MSRPSIHPALLSVASIAAGALIGFTLAPSSGSAEASDGQLTPDAADVAADSATPLGAGIGVLAPSLGGTAAASPDVSSVAGDADSVSADGASTGRAAVERQEAAVFEAAPGSVLEELHGYLLSGSVERRFAEREAEAAGFLIQQYLADGDPTSALERLRKNPDMPAGNWGTVAQALAAGGDPALALEAYRSAIQHAEHGGQWNWAVSNWINELGALDAGMALALLDEQTSALEVVPPDLSLISARFLAEQGRVEEARAELLGLLGADQEIYSALSQLSEIDPALAEEELIARNDPENGYDLEDMLFNLLHEQGRDDEAIALLEERLARGYDASSMIVSALENMTPDQIDEHLEGWLANSPDAYNLQVNVGSHFLAQGDVARASEHFTRSWEDGLDMGAGWLPSLPQEILDADPVGSLAMVRSAANRAGEQDELWGDVGDHYWRLGYEDDAIAAWREAQRIDPDDGEWTGKVSNYEAGDDPINGGGGSLQSLGYLGYSSSVITDSVFELGY